jgi:hypothetical protein
MAVGHPASAAFRAITFAVWPPRTFTRTTIGIRIVHIAVTAFRTYSTGCLLTAVLPVKTVGNHQTRKIAGMGSMTLGTGIGMLERTI